MANVYLTFLGTNNYLECNYVVPGTDFRCSRVRFVQEATLKLACADWNTADRGVVFVTDDAKKKNWADDGHYDRKTGSYPRCKGLGRRLSELRLPFEVRPVPIPEGNSTDEIWDIFKQVFDCLDDGDRIVFDITHAFRSIPMLAIVMLNYAKVLKGVKVEGIYYGAFEKLGSINDVKEMDVKDRDVPILDLTDFDLGAALLRRPHGNDFRRLSSHLSSPLSVT